MIESLPICACRNGNDWRQEMYETTYDWLLTLAGPTDDELTEIENEQEEN